MQMIFVPFSIGLDPSLEGLRRVVDPDRQDLTNVWLLGAWQLGDGTDYRRGTIYPGRDWLAVAWRAPDGRLGSYGRVREHREHLGIGDSKVFYTATAADEKELVRIYDRVAGRLSKSWGVPQHKVLGLEGHRFLDWLGAMPGLQLTIKAPGGE